VARGKNSETLSRRKNVSFKDVQIAFLSDGIGGVAAMTDGKKTAAVVIRRAIEGLKALGRETSALEGYVHERFGSRARGRPTAGIGDDRRYKAQQVKELGTYLRLPLTSLSVKKGGVVRVRFEADQILVMKQ
jgi:hypothetical protein